MHKDIKLHYLMKLMGGRATPAPPVGTIIGPSGINIQEFCERFNRWSKEYEGQEIEFGIIIYTDLTFDILSKKQYLEFKSNEINLIMSTAYHNWENEQYHNSK